ncbi:ABC1 family protein, mitochondrial, partial [Pseudocercospora fuligena]
QPCLGINNEDDSAGLHSGHSQDDNNDSNRTPVTLNARHSMRATISLGRTCLGAIHNTAPIRPQVIRHINYSIRSGRSTNSFSSLFQNARRTFRPPPAPVKGGTLLLAALSPAAFVSIAEDDKDNSGGKTHEEHMLEISRKEIEEYVPERLRNSKKVRVGLWKFLDTWVYEPIATTFRFFHLVIIFVPVIATVPIIWFGARQKDKDDERSGTLWWYGFLVSSMERAGAAFIKLGQWAASRTDIFPTQMCRIMSALHSNAPAHSLQVTKETIERAFGRRFEDIFDEFDETPLGVGAIAQVYKAKLKPDLVGEGQEEIETEPQNIRERALRTVDPLLKSTPNRVPSTYVAIKVLHPKIERIVRRDLCIMGAFANIINAIPTMEWFSFPDEVKQFGEMMRLQLDLRIEAANLTLFRKNFRHRSTAWFPYPYTQYTTRQVLVEEFATGIPLEHFLQNGGGVFQKEIADEGLDAFLHMLLIDNFIHADLHPGNIMVRFYRPATVRDRTQFPSLTGKGKPDVEGSEDVTEQVISRLKPHRHDKESWLATLKQIDKENYRPQLIFIDAGLVTELNETNRKNFLDLFKSVAEFDGYKSGKLMVERCRQPDAVIDEEVFALRMQHLVLGVKSRTFALGNIKIGDILNEVLDMVRSHHVRLEGDFVNVVLSILLLEGIGRTLDPDLDLFSGALPILRQLGAQSGKSMLTSGDLSMVKVWAGLEARKFLQASIESVEMCVKYDQLSPNI